MKLEDRAPEVEKVDVGPAGPVIEVIDLRPFAADIAGAIEAAGPEETGAAVALVQAGKAAPEALLAWIDDLRDPEQHAPDVDPAEQQQGFVPDFLMDTEIAGGAMDTPPRAGNDAAEAPPAAPDDDYFFSAVRRRRRDDDEQHDPSDPPEQAPEITPGADKARSER